MRPRTPALRLAMVVVAAVVASIACGARTSLDLPLRDEPGGSGAGQSGVGAGEGTSGGGGSDGSNAGTSGTGGDGTGPRSGTGEGSGGLVFGRVTGCGDTGPAPPSCAPGGPGMTNCGACSESCCRSVEVTGGTSYRTYTYTADGGQGPQGEADPATVSSLRVDKYLVTVGRFRQFANAWDNGAGYIPAAASGKHTHLNSGQGLSAAGGAGGYEPGWDPSDDGSVEPTDPNLSSCTDATWTASPGSNENLPANCVDWAEAYAFCIWDGAFLPSEAEWEFVAAGGSEQREYAWGGAAPGDGNRYAIYGYDNSVDCYYPSAGVCTGVANIAPVGAASDGAGRWSHLDLAGDVGEWALDWFAPYVDPCTDCAQLSRASLRTIRGGAYHFGVSYLVPAFRDGRYPPGRNGDVGFRCARTP